LDRFSPKPIFVPAKNLNEIRELASSLRDVLRLKSGQAFPTLRILETINDRLAEDDKEIFQVVEDDDLPYAFADTDSVTGLIRLRNSCYQSARHGEKEGVFTVSHEYGHSICHRGVKLHRFEDDVDIPEENDSEIQADSFAIELLVSHVFLVKNLKRLGPEAICERFRIPLNKMIEHIERMRRNGDFGPRPSSQLELPL